MAMNVNEVKTVATEAVLDELVKLYENADRDGMQDFAEAIAQAAVTAVQHVIDNAEIADSGAGLI